MQGDSNSNTPQSVFNAAVISVSIQVGCLTLVTIFASLILGLWLDRTFETRPLFTILLLVASMPLTWIGVFWSVNRAKNRLMKPPMGGSTKTYLEEDNSDG
jgi:F0F1-type ATP synthase assembly protein I